MSDIIKIYHEDTGREVVAYVLRQTESMLRVAINGSPVMLTRVGPGEYRGRAAGMSLTTKRPL